jgi:ABC-2 type transport system permease protein
MLQQARKYWQTWKMTAFSAFQETFINRWTNLLFFVGKGVRFAMMLLFLLLLRENVNQVGAYTSGQMIAFFVTYSLIDTIVQVVYRGIYTFGQDVRSGKFDGTLVRPINPLFTVLTGQPDINDAVFLIPTVCVSVYLLATSGLTITWLSAGLYVALLANSFILATALQIIIASLTIMTTDADNFVWIYRDVTRLGQFPITIYFEAIRIALFFIVPVGMMFTIPAQVLLNTAPSYSLVIVTSFTVFFFWLSLRIWNRALRSYSSASS